MRKVILSAVVVLFSTAVFANKAKVTGVENKFSVNINATRLGDYLDLNYAQTADVERISEFFAWQLERSAYHTEAKRNESVKKAVYVNLKSMKQTLSDTQYKKYLQVLNTTLQNKGLWDYVMACN